MCDFLVKSHELAGLMLPIPSLYEHVEIVVPHQDFVCALLDVTLKVVFEHTGYSICLGDVTFRIETTRPLKLYFSPHKTNDVVVAYMHTPLLYTEVIYKEK